MREPPPRGRPPPLTPLGEPDLDHLSQAPEPLVRAILLTLCDDERVKARALRYFDRLLRFEEAQDGLDDLRSPTSGVVPAKNARKRRKTGNPRICVQCDAIYVDEDNEFGACRYHAGVLQLFDETKIDIDWDTADDDDVDTNAMRAAFPDAFRWLCCSVPGSHPGCRRGRHEANPELSRKGRESASQESSLDRDPLHLDEAVSSQQGTDGGVPEYAAEGDEKPGAAADLARCHRRPLERRSASRDQGRCPRNSSSNGGETRHHV